MIGSIEKHGNYSPESTLDFLRQAQQCRPEPEKDDDHDHSEPKLEMVRADITAKQELTHG